MRSLVITAAMLVAALALANGASARAVLRTPAEPYGHIATARQSNYYRPCPANVVFADGRHGCLGCPAGCNFDH
jgi:hypothetical protein